MEEVTIYGLQAVWASAAIGIACFFIAGLFVVSLEQFIEYSLGFLLGVGFMLCMNLGWEKKVSITQDTPPTYNMNIIHTNTGIDTTYTLTIEEWVKE